MTTIIECDHISGFMPLDRSGYYSLEAVWTLDAEASYAEAKQTIAAHTGVSERYVRPVALRPSERSRPSDERCRQAQTDSHRCHRWYCHVNPTADRLWAVKECAHRGLVHVPPDDLLSAYAGRMVDATLVASCEAAIDRAIVSRENEALVVLESMPARHRSSHRAAGNFGAYPANGSIRYVMPRVEAQEVVDSDEDGYDHIVRGATDADVLKYGTEDRPDGW